MALDRISVRLSPFEKLHILRSQLEEREEELREVEATIREKLSQIETQRYLEGLSPYYAQRKDDVPTVDDINALEEKRNQIAELITTINEQIPIVVEQTQGGGGSQQSAAEGGGEQASAGQARKVKFDNFDDFAAKSDKK